jgi:hypothetical protein
MNKRNLCVVAIIGASLVGATSVALADGIVEKRIQPRGQFQLDNGDSFGVKRGNATHGYRICMDDTPHAVPLRVKYDGKEDIVAPGECHLIEAKSIRLSSAGRLQDGMLLVGRSSRATMGDAPRMAQVARDD